MAPSIVHSDAVLGETFLPGQIFVFGGFVLRANSLGHLEQIDRYDPGHQVRFGSVNYIADIRGDLIFEGFETTAIAPPFSDEHDLNLSSEHIQRCFNSIRDLVQVGDIEICKIHTDLNVADPLTKPLPRAKHDQHQDSMGVRIISVLSRVNNLVTL